MRVAFTWEGYPRCVDMEGPEMAHRVKPVGRAAWRAVGVTVVWLSILSGGARAQDSGVLSGSASTPDSDKPCSLREFGCSLQEYFLAHTHGYLDNFVILRNNTFKDDYHVASDRYRVSLQFSGPIGDSSGQPLGLPLSRLEYFMELRPEYESIYDISPRFGNDNGISTSGRGQPPGASNAALLKAFGFNPNNFEQIYDKSNLRIVDA